MAKREINVFNVSFIDLLSGALGAVLILFIVIPKLTGDIKIIIDQMEQLQELKVEVNDIEKMMKDLKKSVPKDELKKMQGKFTALENKIKDLTSTITELDKEIKLLQTKAAECDEQRKKLREQKKKLEQQVKDLKSQLENHDSIVKALEKEIEQLKQQIAKCETEKQSLNQQIQEQKLEIQKVTDQNTKLSQEKSQLQKDLEKAQQTIKEQQKKLENCKTQDQHLDIKENVVFVVDISGSMTEQPEPEKFDEIRAGIKMMVANMNEKNKVDIVIFPKNKDERYGYKFGKLTTVSQSNKYAIYQYLSSLNARGCTPTRDVMDFVLSHSAYDAAGTIIYMSDGLPTVRLSDIKCGSDDVNDLLGFIKNKNAGKHIINCIGVGKDFRNQVSGDKKVQFMKDLSSQNNGFYIGF